MYNFIFYLAIFFLGQGGGNRIQIDDVKSKASFEPGITIFDVFGSFTVEPFDIRDSDAYVLFLSNAGGKLELYKYEKFVFKNVSILTYNWSYSISLEDPDDDFNTYVVLVDRFNDKYFDQFEAEIENMGSFEEFIGKLRKTDRIDPLNFSVYWVRIN